MQNRFKSQADTGQSAADSGLPKRYALPVFTTNALSSVSYAPDQILLTLGLGGMLCIRYFRYGVGLAVFAVMAIIIISYRQVVRAYPSGGGRL